MLALILDLPDASGELPRSMAYQQPCLDVLDYCIYPHEYNYVLLAVDIERI